MIPVHDDNPTRSKPVVTYVLIAANVLMFLWQQVAGDIVMLQYALFPFRITGAEPQITGRLQGELYRLAQEHNLKPAWETLFTSMFLHGGWMHLIGNMVFLAIFGNNIEDVLGKIKFTLFYLFCGAAAGYAHVLFAPGSVTPTVGASGAIAGVLGAYLLLFPHSRVTCLVIFFFVTMIELPAKVVLGFWFLLQFVQGLLGWGELQRGGGGVAYAAHIGGFVIGYLVMMLIGPRRPPRPRYYVPPEAFPQG